MKSVSHSSNHGLGEWRRRGRASRLPICPDQILKGINRNRAGHAHPAQSEIMRLPGADHPLQSGSALGSAELMRLALRRGDAATLSFCPPHSGQPGIPPSNQAAGGRLAVNQRVLALPIGRRKAASRPVATVC